MKLKAVLFDLDGTLLDTHQDLGAALNGVLKAHGLQTLPMEVIRAHVSNGANALVKLGFGNSLSNEQHQNLRSELLSHYMGNIAEHTTLFMGLQELLLQLHTHQIQWGIVTNKPKIYTDALLQQLTFTPSPAVVVCPEDAGIAKPDPKPLLHACKLIPCTPAEAIYVGDHKRDIDCAIAANMASIAVGYGFIEPEDNYLAWNANYYAQTTDNLWPIIQTHFLN